MRITTWIFVISTIVGLLFHIGPTYCWESDMHYGLTKWLAFNAGCSLDDAEIIAAGAESADESSALKASAVMAVYACAGRSSEASRHVQQHHFPSNGFVPSERQLRKVSPGKENMENSGNRWVRQEITVHSVDENKKTVLNRFGQSLHPLADSWSHQGVPGRGFITCSEDLIWAHSDKRGGWMSHDADLTHKFVGDAVASAKAVYYFMGQFLKANSSSISRPNPQKPWSELKDDVEKFAKAKTALDKKKWFKSHLEVPLDSYSTYPCFLRNTILRDHDKICKKEDNQENSKRSESKTMYGQPKYKANAADFFDNFLISWIVRGNVDELISTSMDVGAIKHGLLGGNQDLRINTSRWLRTLLLMWLIPDHGLVNELGHGISTRDGFNTLADIVSSRRRRMKFTNLKEAIQFPDSSWPYQIVELEPLWKHNDSFAAIFQFRHTPRDTLFLIADKVHGSYRVVAFFWMVS